MLTPRTLKKLQLEQKKLDEFIVKNKNITDTKDEGYYVWGKVALLVEIGELANELKTFKRWKSQKEVDWEKAKEELIDCFHFYLSFTNTFRIDFSDYNKFQEKFSEKNSNIVAYDLSPQSITRFNELLLGFFSEADRMIGYIPEKVSFYRWLMIFEELAQKLGMKNEKDIEDVYMTKNKKNWERQDNKNY